MELRELTNKDQKRYNKLVTHVIQSWQWGEARQALGTKVRRYGLFKKNQLLVAFQITFHHIPFTKYFVGYLPKGPLPDKNLAQALERIGRENGCAFIKVEPNIIKSKVKIDPRFRISPKPLFTKHNFVIDLSKSEPELLKAMHHKTRYNIKLAEKHGVKVNLESSDKAFRDYLKLYFDTTKRQNYHGHNIEYHTKIWQTLKKAKMAQLLIAYYKDKPLTAWMLLNFNHILYYPYGGSSDEYKNLMSSTLVGWKAIKLGQQLNCQALDLWGALGENPNPKDPWFGFHRFKSGFGGKLVEYLGSFDLIFNKRVYLIFTTIDKMTKLKVMMLKLIK